MSGLFSRTSVPVINVTDLHTAKAAGDVPILVDVRTPAEFDSGHAPGAINIPLSEVTARRDELAPYDGGPVYLICRSGARSGNAAQALIPMGVEAINVEGGTMAWMKAGFPVES